MICIILVALDLRNVGVFAVKHKARDEVLRTYVANLVRTLQMVAWPGHVNGRCVLSRRIPTHPMIKLIYKLNP